MINRLTIVMNDMATILIRYSEIGLKSDPVRRKLEKHLRMNIIDMLSQDGVEALVTIRNSRLYVETDRTDDAVRSLKKVFGIGSLSIADTTSSDKDEICRFVADYSRKIIGDGESFAIRARREGTHEYTSMELERDVGSAVMEANADRGIRVNLTDPDRPIFIEVRNNLAYIFSEYIRCHAGLPVGSQGRVVADVSDDRGVVSAWLMMKRGCRVIVRGDYGLDLLSPYDPHIRNVPVGTPQPNRAYGIALGTPLRGWTASTWRTTTCPCSSPRSGCPTRMCRVSYPPSGMCEA